MALQGRLVQHEDDEAQQHADACEPEAGPPADGLAQEAAQHRRPEGPEVDPVIVEREARIPPGIPLRIELPHDGGDVGLEEAHPHDDQT
jgi:hypothetical protein